MESKGKIVFRHFPELGGVVLVRGNGIAHKFPRHAHASLCIGRVYRGKRELVSADTTISVGAGSGFIIETDRQHRCVAGEAHTYSVLSVPGGFLSSGNKEACKNRLPRFSLQRIMDRDVLELYERTVKVLGEASSILEKESALFSFIMMLDRHYGCEPAEDQSGKNRGAVMTAKVFIEERYKDDPALADMAEAAGLSPYHFIRVFCDRTGVTPHEYLTGVRMRHARTLLSQGVPIVDVALSLGYSDQSHFTRYFKRIIGITPGAYVRFNR